MFSQEMNERMLSLPGAISVVFLLSVVLPATAIFPRAITLPMMIAFSIPTFYMFMTWVILNRRVSLKKHLLITVVASYVLYIVSQYPFAPQQFYIHSFFFALGAIFGGIAYLIYYLLYRLGKDLKKGELSYRYRFLICFIPTILFMLIFSFLISMFFGSWLFELEALTLGGEG